MEYRLPDAKRSQVTESEDFKGTCLHVSFRKRHGGCIKMVVSKMQKAELRMNTNRRQNSVPVGPNASSEREKSNGIVAT